MNVPYSIPDGARIGHIHLKVSNLERSLEFYCNVLGFKLISMYGEDAAFISAGGYHHHIGLNTWYSKDTPTPSPRCPGLFHAAILYPTRKDLAIAYQRLSDAGYSLTGVADHGVSEALYLDDPDHNGLELYWDRPNHLWPRDKSGTLKFFSDDLDLDSLLQELNPTLTFNEEHNKFENKA